VVVELLGEAECDDAVASFWDEVRQWALETGRDDYPKPDDPYSWETDNWPSRGKFLLKNDAETGAAFRNRTHPRLHQAFSIIFGHQEILTKIDKWGCMRGTIMPDGSVRKDWRWQLEPHWDCNPHQYLEETTKLHLPRMYQGLVALTENNDWTGGFRCCPGSSKHLAQWCATHPRDDRFSKYPQPSDPWYHQLQRVPLKKGQMVIFDAGTLHANYENTGPDMRIVQFLRCIDPRGAKGNNSRQKHLPQNHQLPKGLELSELGKKMLGIEKW